MAPLNKQTFLIGILMFVLVAFSCTHSKKTTSQKEVTEVREPKPAPPKPKIESVEKTPAEEKSKESSAPKKSSKEQQLEAFCSEWSGTPYRYGGSSKTGTDCSGFASQLYREVYEISLPRSSGEMAKLSIRVEEKDLRSGDLVFFKINGKTISHVGVYLGDKKFIHASTKRGVIISHLDEEYYRRTFSHGGRF